MTEKSLTEKIQLIKMDDLMARTNLEAFHMMKAPARAVKPSVKAALEIVGKKPGGTQVIAELQKRAKLGKSSSSPGTLIGSSEPGAGDAWYAHNAEVSGPGPTSVMFCCVDGPSMGCHGYWRVWFQMPQLDDLLIMVHVSGYGTLSVELDGGPTAGTYSFAGEDWIALALSDVSVGGHNLKVIQESGYFHWLGTYYYTM